MILSEKMYVPVLHLRQSEYQALRYLKPRDKDKIMPLICIPDVELDSETWKAKKTVHDHVLPSVGRWTAKWGNRPAWLALHEKIAKGRMNDHSHVFNYILNGLRSEGAHAVPVLTLESDADAITAAAGSIGQDRYGAGIRIHLEKLMSGGSEDSIAKLAKKLLLPLEEVDLIVDLRAPNFKPYQHFAKALINILNGYRDLSVYRNFVIVSSAIPAGFGQIARGIDEIPRHDWLFYKALLAALPSGIRRPNYGDYTTVHPEFKLDIDMRMINPAGKIIYTTPTIWATCKGPGFRKNETQMIDHCKTVMTNPQFQFRGADFSDGDKYIAQCAAGEEGTGNLGRWKRVSINHHITAAVNDLANYYASL